jgi:hypothetical protein
MKSPGKDGGAMKPVVKFSIHFSAARRLPTFQYIYDDASASAPHLLPECWVEACQ